MKVEVQNYKCSINETNYSDEQIKIIWDFYVTKSVASSASQKRVISDYGQRFFPWEEMLKIADVTPENKKILLADTINKTLRDMDLEIQEGKDKNKHNKAIEIDIVKIVCITPYSISDEEEPKPKVGEAESVLTHIRNAFAHGNTYFFENGNVLFEDKNARGAITARIILKQQTLLDWIKVVDKDSKYYSLVDVCASDCPCKPNQ